MNKNNDDLKNYLEATFGSDIKSLHNIENIYQEALKKKLKLEEQLSVATTEVPTKIEEALSSAQAALVKVDQLEIDRDSINADLTACLEKCAPAVERFQQTVRKVNEIDRYISYMKWMAKIEDTSGGVQQSILSDSMGDACLMFKNLVQIYTDMLSNSTKCHNLVAFLRKTIMFWYNILKDKLSKELDGILKQINWPFVSAPGPHTLSKAPVSTDKQAPSPYTAPDPASNLESIIGNLLNIQLPVQLRRDNANPDINNDESETSTMIGDVQASTTDGESGFILLPFQLMLRPLKKRFRYHFTGSKQTNALHKPEWYLAQILNWIGHHAGFMEHTVQSILDKNEHSHIDALVMFTQGLLQLVTAKLSVDIEEIIYANDLFSHTVDEVLLFDRELRSAYDIPDVLLKTNGPLNILARDDCMRKWLNIERTCAVDRLDALLSSEQAWKSKFTSTEADDVDEMKTPECAESFVTMLLTITDRYKHLPSDKEQLQFLDLQLLLLDDFRIRLTQVLRSVASNHFDDVTIAILNASYYITIVLKEWADNVFFLELKYHKDQLNSKSDSNPVLPKSLLDLGEATRKPNPSSTGRSTDETVFEPIVVLYERIYNEGIEDIAQFILAEFKAKSQPYLNDQWLALPSADEQVTFIVSRTACPMLEVLQERLHAFDMRLCRALFTQLWRKVAEMVDVYLINELIIENHFNAGGALQLQFDMIRNLFPLFGPYTNKPDNYFKRTKEACILLNLQLGSALLLKEVFQSASQPRDPGERAAEDSNPATVLAELGVHLLKPNDTKRIVNRRVDWTTS